MTWNKVRWLFPILLVTLLGFVGAGVLPSKAAVGVPDWPNCSGIVRSPRSGWPWESATRGGVVVAWYESLRLEVPELPNLPALATLTLNEKVTACSIRSSGTVSPGLGATGSTEIYVVRGGGEQLDLLRFDAEQFTLVLPSMMLSEIPAAPGPGGKVLEPLPIPSSGDRALARSLSDVFEDSRQLVVFNAYPMFQGELNFTVVGSDDCGVFSSIVVWKSGHLDIDDRVVTGSGFALSVQGTPAVCAGVAPGLVREILSARTAVMFDRNGLSLRSSKGSAQLQESKTSTWQTLDISRTTEKRHTYRGARRVALRPESPGVWQRMAIDGCGNLKVVFGVDRYVIVDDHIGLKPNLRCMRSAARGLLTTNGGIYERNEAKLVLRSSSGTVLKLQIRN